MEKSEHFLTRGYEKIKKSRLRAFARTRAKKNLMKNKFGLKKLGTKKIELKKIGSKKIGPKKNWAEKKLG